MQLLLNTLNKIKMPKSIKKRTLLEFLDENKHLPEQGSIEWLKSRSYTIGGSEISTILNINKYQSIKQLISQKAGVNIFKKAPPLWFGSIFEHLLQLYVEKLYDTKIYETGSIQYKKSKFIKYSPDGLAVIKLNKLKNLFTEDDLNNKIFNKSIFNNEDLQNKKELLILFEFKNPYMRVIQPNEIPIYYVNQPKLGMEVIEMCEASIFIESIFRFCSYNDIVFTKTSTNNLPNNKYNTYYHYDKVRYTDNPLSFGCFSLYYKKTNMSNHLNDILSSLLEYFHTNNTNLHEYDLSGIKDKTIINKIMENIIDYKDIKIIHHDLCINTNIYDNNEKFYFEKYNNINKFKENIIKNKENINNDSELEYLGIISFKMFKININPIFKSNPINEDVLQKIEKVINIIAECNQLADKDLKKKLIKSVKF